MKPTTIGTAFWVTVCLFCATCEGRRYNNPRPNDPPGDNTVVEDSPPLPALPLPPELGYDGPAAEPVPEDELPGSWGSVEGEYHLFTPRLRSADALYPMVVCLHSQGGAKYFSTTGQEATKGMYVLYPIPPTKGEGWDIEAVSRMVRDIAANNQVDTKRVSCMGQAAGAVATVKLAADHPGLFWAITPISGFAWPVKSYRNDEDMELIDEIASKVAKVPFWGFQPRKQQPLIPLWSFRAAITAMQQHGGNPAYVEYSHGSIAGDGGKLARWLVGDWPITKVDPVDTKIRRVESKPRVTRKKVKVTLTERPIPKLPPLVRGPDGQVIMPKHNPVVIDKVTPPPQPAVVEPTKPEPKADAKSEPKAEVLEDVPQSEQ